MKNKEKMPEQLVQRMVQKMIRNEIVGWPPITFWGNYQPHRPENKPKNPNSQSKK
ncbi:MAG: hypothetical protein PHO10_06810 [Gemmiger sp.]|nr:hypothetical protein [Gemmiger sp.]